MFEVSWFGSLRRDGEKLQQRELFRTASSYYIPEGRFYAAPLVLKQKHRHNFVMPVVLGLGLSLFCVSNLQNEKNLDIKPVKTTVFAKNSDDISNILQQNTDISLPHDDSSEIDSMTTASTTLLQSYRSEPMSDENAGQKLGISDPNPDEARINSKEKTSNFVRRKTSMLPELSKKQMQRLDVEMLPQASDGKYVTTMVSLAANDGKKSMALRIVPPPKPKTLAIPKALASLVTNKQADILALGYAPEPAKNDASPFDSIMSNQAPKPAMGRFIPPIGKDDHAWAATPLPADTFSDSQQQCLAEAIYFESRGESIKGQAAVAQVVLNRVRNPAYPANVCGVVYQNTNWRNQCQFSFACDGINHQITEMPQWTLAKQIAKAVSAGQIWLPEIGSATHYHATYVRPNWARSMVKMDKIGLHIFYRTIGGGWS